MLDEIGFPVWLVAVGACLLVFYTSPDKDNKQPMQMVAAGTLENVSITTGILKDVSTLILADGTRVTVDGAVSRWKPGAAVQHPATVPTDSIKQQIHYKQWCITDTCYPQL